MSLMAHTNAPGVHFLNESRIANESGVYRDNASETYVNFSNDYFEAKVNTAISRKPLPVRGDHTSPTQYGRSIERVVDDQPFVLLEESYSHLDRPQGPILQLRKETKGYISSGEGGLNRYPIGKLDEDNPISEADTKCLLDLGGAKAQLGAEIAQIRQSVDLLANTASRAAGFLLALKRGQFGRIPGILSIDPRLLKSDRGRSQANAWLEYSYGWKPLADECFALQEAAIAAMTRDLTIKGRGYGQIEGSWDYTSGENQWQETAQSKVKTIVHAKIANESLFTLNNIGLANPLSIGWELLPWSFAIDWFIPVGNVLEAATATFGLNFVKGWRSKQMTYTTECTKRLGFRNPWVQVVQPGSFKEEGFFFFRDPLTGFPRPSFYADTTPFSTPRAVNALALIRQLFT